jgi:chromosome segregation ATPase
LSLSSRYPFDIFSTLIRITTESRYNNVLKDVEKIVTGGLPMLHKAIQRDDIPPDNVVEESLGIIQARFGNLDNARSVSEGATKVLFNAEYDKLKSAHNNMTAEFSGYKEKMELAKTSDSGELRSIQTQLATAKETIKSLEKANEDRKQEEDIQLTKYNTNLRDLNDLRAEQKIRVQQEKESADELGATKGDLRRTKEKLDNLTTANNQANDDIKNLQNDVCINTVNIL